jgi:4-amino-4-deoxy-L-arabinose transferase-like glycosyltransferase
VNRAAIVALAVVLVAAAGLRFAGGEWDEGAHLHPDERYLAIVADTIRWPSGVREYFDVERSPLSPYNTEQGRDYLYGTLPLFATKLVGSATGQDAYGELNLVGRRLSAALDTVTILLVFGIGLLLLAPLGRPRAEIGALLAAALYGFTVTMIQHAHYFTTEAWLVFFGTATFLLGLLGLRRGVSAGARSPSPVVLLTGLALGLTIACKVSGALVALPVAIALLGRALTVRAWAGTRWALLRLGVEAGLVALAAYVAFRLVSPYTFARSNWLDVSVNSSLRDSLERQAQAVAGFTETPPAYQWLLSSPIWSPLENLALWQLGVPLALAALVGLGTMVWALAVAGRDIVRHRQLPADAAAIVPLVSQLMVVAFVLATFAYFASRFVHAGRYLLPLVPLLPVAAAYGVTRAASRRPAVAAAAGAVVVAVTSLYAVAFAGIYERPNTRMAATAWLNETLPPGTTIANEHWDDPLPVGGNWTGGTTGFVGVEVPVFGPDDEQKLRILHEQLAQADVYVLSSPRAWNTIGRLPERFPLMARFYDELFAGRLPFEQVAMFESYPSLLGLELRDRRAEEAFWVYDHPPVTIFRRTAPLDWETFKRRLCPRPDPPECA